MLGKKVDQKKVLRDHLIFSTRITSGGSFLFIAPFKPSSTPKTLVGRRQTDVLANVYWEKHFSNVQTVMTEEGVTLKSRKKENAKMKANAEQDRICIMMWLSLGA